MCYIFNFFTQVSNISSIDWIAEGISFIGELIDYGVKLDIVDKSGAWFSYGSNKLGQGKENAKTTIKDNPEMMREIEDKIKAKLKEDES